MWGWGVGAGARGVVTPVWDCLPFGIRSSGEGKPVYWNWKVRKGVGIILPNKQDLPFLVLKFLNHSNAVAPPLS